MMNLTLIVQTAPPRAIWHFYALAIKKNKQTLHNKLNPQRIINICKDIQVKLFIEEICIPFFFLLSDITIMDEGMQGRINLHFSQPLLCYHNGPFKNNSVFSPVIDLLGRRKNGRWKAVQSSRKRTDRVRKPTVFFGNMIGNTDEHLRS